VKLGTKLILYLILIVIVVMTIHGYLSVQQDKENLTAEIRVGMRGFSRAIQTVLAEVYANRDDLKGTQDAIDKIGPRGNIHGLIVYDTKGKPIALSASLKETQNFPDLDPTPLLQIDPAPVLANGKGMDGYIYNSKLLIYYRVEPIFDARGAQTGAFILGRQGYGPTRAIETRQHRIIVTTSMLVLVLSILVLFIVRRNVSTPIRHLIERIREIGRGNWDQKIKVSSRNEIGALAQEFNLMAERLRATYAELMQAQEEKIKLERNLRHSEKLASVGQLGAGLAHEIGTPLNIIGGRAEHLLRRQRSPDEINENLRIIQSQTDRIAGIVRQLLEFSRRKEPALRSVDVPALVESIRSLLQHKTAEKRVRVEVSAPAGCPRIMADPDLLQQVFINLFMNALQAMGNPGLIKITFEGAQAPVEVKTVRGDLLKILFEDNGPGIPSSDLERVFDPFFTTKDVGEGTGLGLSVSYGIIKDHGGEIRVESEPGAFTRFTIFLPLDPRQAQIEAPGLRL
jgi:signal transduction histidine kinase